jgi:Leucine-rich repeat (LRR) protein
MNNIILETGIYGCRAVLNSFWSDQFIGYLTENGVVELELNQGKGWRGTDLSFLSGLRDLKAFEILDLNIKDITPIHCLNNLRRLGVTTYCSTGIDFSAFSKLESCALEWRRKATSLFDCTTLKTLFVNRYKGKAVAPFATLANLESLAILNAPIENLHGLSAMIRLRSLRLAGLRRLRSLAGIEGLANLEELEVNSCRSISSIEPVAFLTQLQRLYLDNDGNIKSLKPIERLGGLVSVAFPQSTNILDGDLSPLLRQRRLSCVAFKNRRHYSHRQEDLV